MRLWLLAWALLLPAVLPADERILDFHSDIVVMENGWIEVTETISVQADGDRIRRGIYRDFPTDYRDKLGNVHEVKFEPLAVLRNGKREDFHAERIGNGVRVYFGNASRFIATGRHSYRFRYRASRMLGFFEDHDELYWNVTGFDWAFPINKASATVTLQFDVPTGEISHEAYTGPYGARGSDYESRVEASDTVYFEATEPLSPVNGLTIVVGWPKGLVASPTPWQRATWLLTDNANVLVALCGLVALLVYFVPVWRHFGKDPDEGVLVTRYLPPEGFSPASLRYIRQMYYDDKVMTAAIVNLAVKGYLQINVSEGSSGFLGIGAEDSEHSLTQTDPGEPAPALAAGEKELYEELFRDGKTVVLDTENHELLGGSKAAHKASLAADYRKHYFRTNGLLIIPGAMIAIGTTIVAFNFGRGPVAPVVALVVAMFVAIVAFAVIMKRPTLRGRRVLDEMLGFKDYLEVAEKDEMNLRNPPEKTPQLFEAYLPFALALGVDQRWAEKFAGVLAAVGGPEDEYRPGWFNGSWSVSRLSASTSQLSDSLNAAVSSSVTPPGSSSGSGGGGFAGGGGGGGGGGGW